MTRFPGSATRNSMTCEPTWPAPPVTRMVRSVTRCSPDHLSANRVIREAQLRHAVERVEVAAVDDDRATQRPLDATEVWMSVLVPIGDDRERVGVGQRVVARRREVYAIAQPSFALVHSDRIVGHHCPARPGNFVAERKV